MNEAPSLFDYVPPAHAAARRTDPVTSREAATLMTAKRVSELERIVLNALDALNGATIEEVALHAGYSLVSISPRFRPLANKSLIIDSGEKRLTKSGRKAIVWRRV